MQQQYDIVIVGGGMVGSALACTLGDSALRIAVLEKGHLVTQNCSDDYDSRVSAITLASQRMLARLGAWQDIEQQRFHPYQRMHIWDAVGHGCLDFDCADIGQAQLGYIIENRVIQSFLQKRLQQLSNIDFLGNTEISVFAEKDQEIEVHCQDGKQTSCRLLVAADGANSVVRSLAGIDSHGWSYQQQAIVATVVTEHPHQDTAWQRFLPTGPLAFLPLDDPHSSSIVWSADTAEAEKWYALNDVDFCTALQQAFDNKLGMVEHTSTRQCFPLSLAHATHYIQSRLALVGDAAHRVHPLAGQGVNLGFADAAVLAEVVLSAVKKNQDIGRFNLLRRYERWRKADNVAMLTTTDVLKRLFGTDQHIISSVRSLGMNLINASAFTKDTIMRYATGLSGDLPEVMRP